MKSQPLETLDAVIEAHETYHARSFLELQRLALEIAREKGRITADDIREQVVVHGDRRIIGAALSKLSRDGWLVAERWVNSRVRTSHGRPIRMFTYRPKGTPGDVAVPGADGDAGQGQGDGGPADKPGGPGE